MRCYVLRSFYFSQKFGCIAANSTCVNFDDLDFALRVNHKGAAIGYSIVLFIAGIADNFLKPLMLGRGVEAPMPVILLGALGGMATGGIIGLFIGAVLLAVGYQLFMSWVAQRPGAATAGPPVA